MRKRKKFVSRPLPSWATYCQNAAFDHGFEHAASCRGGEHSDWPGMDILAKMAYVEGYNFALKYPTWIYPPVIVDD